MLSLLTAIGFLALLGWLYLAFFNGGFWKLVFEEPSPEPESWPSVDIIVPARDEAETLPVSLPSLLAQDYPGTWRLILIDDHSQDDTGDLAQRLATAQNRTDHFTVVKAPELPTGWSGKVGAMQAGVTQSTADYVLFTDADIAHPASSLRRLMARAVDKNLDLVSRMVKLHCQNPAERMLIPAFVFFFAMLYPFQRANDPDSHVAAAAGGVMLLRRKTLNNIGGLARIGSSLIDDCTLAKAVKFYGGEHETPGRIELTLSRDIQSLRIYSSWKDIWHMVARTAYTQLKYSPLLLAGAVIGMGVLFVAPVILTATRQPMVTELGLAAWFIMCALYAPMVHFYNLPLARTITLPIAALVYIGATLASAWRTLRGRGGQWKGRSQA